MLQLGYKFNSYVAVEGRYWFGGNDTIKYILLVGQLAGIDRQVDALLLILGEFMLNQCTQYQMHLTFMHYLVMQTMAMTFLQLTTAGDVSMVQDPDTSDSLDGFSWGILVLLIHSMKTVSIYSLTIQVSFHDDATQSFGYNLYSMVTDTRYLKMKLILVNVGVNLQVLRTLLY